MLHVDLHLTLTLKLLNTFVDALQEGEAQHRLQSGLCMEYIALRHINRIGHKHLSFDRQADLHIKQEILNISMVMERISAHPRSSSQMKLTVAVLQWSWTGQWASLN